MHLAVVPNVMISMVLLYQIQKTANLDRHSQWKRG